MIAAVLHAATGVPHAEDFPDPTPQPGEIVVRVLAAGLHPLVRAHARGAHYSSHGAYPMIPGIDGIAELPDGRRSYFGWLRAPYGTFAERAAIPAHATLPVPPGLAPELAAGVVNPAMSSWLALQLRAKLVTGEHVLILGATGASGQLAVQVARALGAGRITAAGRNAEVLGRLDADATVRIDAPEFRDQLARELALHGVDVVLDYLWGPPAEATLGAILAARKELGSRRVRYVNIGEMAGAKIPLSPHVLRSMPIELLGSGLGSVAPIAMAQEIPKLLEQAARGVLTIAIEPTPLSRVADAWTTPTEHGRRIVIVP